MSGNPNLTTNIAGSSSFGGGYYQPGSVPFSAFGSLSGSAFGTAVSDDSTTANYAQKNVTSGTTLTRVRYQTDETTTDYDLPAALSTAGLDLKGLVAISGITTGLFVSSSSDASSANGDSAYFATVNKTFFSDTAGAGLAPAIATDYTTKAVADNVNTASLPAAGGSGADTVTTRLGFGVPFAMRSGELAHFGYARLGFAKLESSAAYSYEESSHAYSAGSAASTDESLAIESKVNQTTIQALYGIGMPGFFMKAAGARFSTGISLIDAITTQKYDYADTQKNYDLSASGAKTAVDGSFESESYGYAAANGIDIALYADHSIPFAPAEGLRFVLKPRVSATFSYDVNGAYADATKGAVKTSSVSYTQNLDSAFAYDGSTYTKTSTAMTGKAPYTSKVGLGVGVPMAIECRPAKWPFGFFAGATPKANLLWTKTATSGQTTTTTAETITAGSVTATTISSVISSSTSTTSLVPTFSEVHAFGIFVPLGTDLRLDIAMNGTNLLAFDNLTFQLIVPLKN